MSPIKASENGSNVTTKELKSKKLEDLFGIENKAKNLSTIPVKRNNDMNIKGTINNTSTLDRS